MEVTCATCSAENPESARFCRKCGTPLGDAAFTEAPTRSLDGNSDTGQPARSLNTFPSAPFGPDAARYAPPIHSPESANLHGFGQVPVVVRPSPPVAKPASSSARWILIVGAFLLLAILGGAATVALIATKIRTARSSPPVVVATPAVPSDADEDDDEDAGDEADVDDDYDSDRLPENVRPWYYENAVGSPTFTKAGDVTVLIMKTTDSPSDVAEFYREHFKDIGVTPNSVEQGSQVVFSGEESSEPVNVVIQGNKKKNPNDPEGKYTRVIVQLGGVKINIPTIPGFGGDDAPPPPPAPPSDTSLPKPPAAPKVQR